ncbi:hypothetical protein BRC64_09860, partial [Halobacteriales archaeon QH_10_67_22]
MTRDLSAADWHQLVTRAEPPSVESSVTSLADDLELSRNQAREKVEEAIAGDAPVEFDPNAGTYGEVTVPGYPTDSDILSGGVTENREQTDDELDSSASFGEIFRRAQDLGGRDRWEMVARDELVTALREAGYDLDVVELARSSDWRQADIADEGDDEPNYRWYYTPAAPDPRVSEFEAFHDCLTAEAPDDY